MRAGRRLDALEADVEGLGRAFDTYRHDLGSLTAEAREAARVEVDGRLEELLLEAEGRIAVTAKERIDERTRAAQASLTARQDEVVGKAEAVVTTARELVGETRAEVAGMHAEIEAIRAALRAHLNIALPGSP
jgi:hypothetical protein